MTTPTLQPILPESTSLNVLENGGQVAIGNDVAQIGSTQADDVNINLSNQPPQTDTSPSLADLPIQIPPFLQKEYLIEAVVPSVFVGRERELAQLDQFLQQTLAGQGQVAFVI